MAAFRVWMRHRAGGITAALSVAAVPAADRLGDVVAVGQHQEKNIAGLKPVPLPRPCDGEGTTRRIDARKLCVLAKWIAPLLKPRSGAVIKVRRVVIAGNVVDLFAPVFRHRAILAM